MFFKKKDKIILDEETKELKAIVNGAIMPIEKAPDAVFSQKMLGDGVAFLPTDKNIYACMDGEVSMVFPTKHAIGLTSKDGIEILIHVGLDTVELNGEPFKMHVEAGQKVKAGDLLMEADFDLIQKRGKGIHIPVVITNANNHEFTYIGEQNIVAKEVYATITKA